MKENNLIKILIPLIAVVVVFESIVLVTNLNKGVKTNTDTTNQVTGSEEAQSTSSETVPLELVFETETKDMKVGKSYKVSVNLLGKEEKSVDGIDLYVKYDSELVDISNLLFSNKNLPQPAFSKASTLKDVVVANFLVSEKDGFLIKKDEVNNLMTFTVTPKKVGQMTFEISTGNDLKESVTMFVESSTGKTLNFSSNKLEVNLTK